MILTVLCFIGTFLRLLRTFIEYVLPLMGYNRDDVEYIEVEVYEDEDGNIVEVPINNTDNTRNNNTGNNNINEESLYYSTVTMDPILVNTPNPNNNNHNPNNDDDKNEDDDEEDDEDEEDDYEDDDDTIIQYRGSRHYAERKMALTGIDNNTLYYENIEQQSHYQPHNRNNRRRRRRRRRRDGNQRRRHRRDNNHRWRVNGPLNICMIVSVFTVVLVLIMAVVVHYAEARYSLGGIELTEYRSILNGRAVIECPLNWDNDADVEDGRYLLDEPHRSMASSDGNDGGGSGGGNGARNGIDTRSTINSVQRKPTEVEQHVKLVLFYKGIHTETPFTYVDFRNPHQLDSVLINEIPRSSLSPSPTSSSSSSSSPSSPSFKRIMVKVNDRQRMVYIIINDIQIEDEGHYRCRVDYYWHRTLNWFMKLELIVPPRKLLVWDEKNNNRLLGNNSLFGPYVEGSENVSLLCEVKHVKPSAHVLWYEGETLIDNTMNIMWENDHHPYHHHYHHLPSLDQQNFDDDDGDDPGNFNKSRNSNNSSSNDHLLRSTTTTPLPLTSTNDDGDNGGGMKNDINIFSTVHNRLVLKHALTRKDLSRSFTCVAWNNEHSGKISLTTHLEMLLPPISVEVMQGTNEAYVENQNIGLICHSYGSRPVAQLTWYRNQARITTGIEDHYDEKRARSTSVLHFMATKENHMDEIVCEAKNIRLTSNNDPNVQHTIRDSIHLTVHYIPNITLQRVHPAVLMENTTNLVSNNAALLLYCLVDANPPIKDSIIWYLNSTQIKNSQSIRITNETLMIEKLNHTQHNGDYQCMAANKIGRAISNKLSISVAYPPRCRDGGGGGEQVHKVGIAFGNEADVICRVDAQPVVVYFDWTFNGTKQAHLKYNSRGTQSILHYQPRHMFDYGLLQCYAQNAAGKMLQPCQYEIVPYGPPAAIRKCLPNFMHKHTDEEEEMMAIAAEVASYGGTPKPMASSPPHIAKGTEGNNITLIRQLSIQCYFEHNGGAHTYCWLEMFAKEDNETNTTSDGDQDNDGDELYTKLIWSGASDPLNEDSGTDFANGYNQCHFSPFLALNNLTRVYKFVFTNYNRIGNATASYVIKSPLLRPPSIGTFLIDPTSFYGRRLGLDKIQAKKEMKMKSMKSNMMNKQEQQQHQAKQEKNDENEGRKNKNKNWLWYRFYNWCVDGSSAGGGSGGKNEGGHQAISHTIVLILCLLTFLYLFGVLCKMLICRWLRYCQRKQQQRQQQEEVEDGEHQQQQQQPQPQLQHQQVQSIMDGDGDDGAIELYPTTPQQLYQSRQLPQMILYGDEEDEDDEYIYI